MKFLENLGFLFNGGEKFLNVFKGSIFLLIVLMLTIKSQ